MGSKASGIAQAERTATAPAVPAVLHVGSGKNFKPDWLNLDAEPAWRPDVVFDLERPWPLAGLVCDTERFGRLHLVDESFDRIVAQDVLEHIRELPTAMTSLLRLLRVGGVLAISVPYELSLGAWSDPTHVRAFNERSFEYFTNWSWYLGWETHHFRVVRMEFVCSEFGCRLEAEGRTMDEILRTPRAIDSMTVELVKQPLDARAREVFRHYRERSPAGG